MNDSSSEIQTTILATRKSPEVFAHFEDIESAITALHSDENFSPDDQLWRQEAAMALAYLDAYYEKASEIAILLPGLKNGYRAIAMASGVAFDKLPSDGYIEKQVDRFVNELLGDNGGVLAAEIAQLFDEVPSVYSRAIVCRTS